MEKYTVDYFINKFEAIPEEKWFSGSYHNVTMERFCALGHCGMRRSMGAMICAGNDETNSLDFLFKIISKDGDTHVAKVNDGQDDRYPQPTPKQRILAALYDIKRMQHPVNEQSKIIHVYHAVEVPATLHKKTKELTEVKN